MALKPCKSCKHEVDATAKTCPNCGVANPGLTAKQQVIGVVLLLVIIAILFKACSGSDGQEVAATTPPPSTAIPYSITKDEQRGNAPRKVEVTLQRRLSDAELAEVSSAIRSSGQFDRTFIGYRVAGQTDTAYWANASFDPEYTSTVIGLSAEKFQKLSTTDLSGYPSRLGTWFPDGALGHLMVLYQENDKYLIDSLFADGGKRSEAYTAKRLPNGDLRLEQPNDFGEYYIVKADGTLQGWSENGMYSSFPPFKAR